MGVQINAPTALFSGKRLSTYFRACWMDTRAVLKGYGEEKNIMALTEFEPQNDQPVASLYTDYCRPVRLFNPVNTHIVSSLLPLCG